MGVLTAQAGINPAHIQPQGETQITVTAYDGFQKPIPQALVKITTEGGSFSASHQASVVGYTDENGHFLAIWHGNLQSQPGVQEFAITTTKNGYVGKFPLTTSAKVTLDDGNGNAEDLNPRKYQTYP